MDWYVYDERLVTTFKKPSLRIRKPIPVCRRTEKKHGENVVRFWEAVCRSGFTLDDSKIILRG